jgi:hypothetical protein
MSLRRGDPHRRRPVHPGPIHGWPDAGYDAALQLLDRQIVDVDGMAVGKVDDVELVEDADGVLVPTGLMVGMAALLPRLGDHSGPRLYRNWVRLAPAHAERRRPGVIDMGLVEDVTSEVHLSVERDGILHRRLEVPEEHPVRRTLGQLLSMEVDMSAAGTSRPGSRRVLDVRLRVAPGGRGAQVAALIVGYGRPGSWLGYERSRERGPRAVAAVVRWWHRHSRLVALGPAVELDWPARRVRVGPDADVRRLDA